MKSAIANEYQPGRWGGKVWVVEGKERGIERERRTGKDIWERIIRNVGHFNHLGMGKDLVIIIII